MNVLMVINKFPPRFGGAAMQATYLAKQLKSRGIGVEFFTDNLNGPSQYDYYNDLKVFRANTWFADDTKIMQQIVYAWKVLYYVFCHRKRFDVVHFHSIRGIEAIFLPLIKLLGKKIIIKLTLVGCDDPYSLKQRKLGVLFSWGLKSVDIFAAISTKLVELAIAGGIPPQKVRAIQNGIDLDNYIEMTPKDKKVMKHKLKYDRYNKVFLSVGRIEPRKGYDFMLKAWKIIEKKFPNSVLLIAGPANDHTNEFYLELLKQIDEDGLKNVHFLGQISGSKELMQAADCFLFCSRAEGFGTVVVESMSSSVPTIATNIEGVTEDIIKDSEIGRICYSDEPADFADIVINFLDEIDMKKLKVAVSQVRETYDIKQVASIYQQMYHRLLGI